MARHAAERALYIGASKTPAIHRETAGDIGAAVTTRDLLASGGGVSDEKAIGAIRGCVRVLAGQSRGGQARISGPFADELRHEVRAELPGAKKEDIAIDIDGAAVSISAKVSSQSERKDGERVLYSERSHESYARAFELPQAVDAQAAEAKFDNGVLTLTLPKKDAPRSTRLPVR